MHDLLPTTEEELDSFLAAFEGGTLPKAQWTHAAHIFTGAYYVHMLGEAAAIDRIRDRVSAYNVAVGGQNTETNGYHETVTVFWIKLLAQFRRKQPALARSPFATLSVEHFALQRDLLRQYYDYDVVDSSEARCVWQPPTLQSLKS